MLSQPSPFNGAGWTPEASKTLAFSAVMLVTDLPHFKKDSQLVTSVPQMSRAAGHAT